MSLAIIIPVYNEEKNINKLIRNWRRQVSKNYNKPYKFIIINDGSTDGTSKVLNKFKKNKKFKIINKKNEGHGLTCLLGYKKSILGKFNIIRSGVYLKDHNVPYRLIKTQIMKKVIYKIPKNIILTNCYLTYLLEKNFRIKWIEINFRKRLFGETKYNFISMLKLVSNLVLSFKIWKIL